MHRLHTIRHIFLGVVLVLVLSALILALTWSLLALRAERVRSDQYTRQIARSLLLSVDSEFNALGAAANVLAAAPALYNSDLGAFHRQATAAVRNGAAINVVLSDRHGQQLINTFMPLGTRLPRHADPELLRRVVASGHLERSDFYVAPGNGMGMLSVCLPVMLDGKLTYFLDAALTASHLDTLLARRALPSPWVVTIMDAGGTIIARSPSSRQQIGTRAPITLRQRDEAERQAHAPLPQMKGGPFDTTVMRSPDSGWTVAIGVPHASALQHALTYSLGGSALLLVAGVC